MPRPSPSPGKTLDKKAMLSQPDTMRVGDPIERTGIYRVIHAEHRVAHFVILLAGQNFPRCARCADRVCFQLVEATTDIQHDRDFRVLLYEIPHPPPAADEEEDEVA